MISKQEYEEIGRKVVSAAFEVHKELGPGFLESVYEICLFEELKNLNLAVERQVSLPVVYKGKTLSKNFCMDMLVENSVVIELKTVSELLPLHEAQLLSYTKLAGLKLGFLINFDVPLIKYGIRRKVNNYFF